MQRSDNMLAFSLEEKEKFSSISLLFNISLAALLVLGTALMVFANFALGAVLFGLGMVLLIGNEYLYFRRSRIRGFVSAKTVSPTKSLSGIFNFALAVLFPAVLALILYFGYGSSEKMLVIVFACMAVASIKVAARTAELFLVK